MAQTVIVTITIRNERLNGIMCMANILLQDIPQVPSMRRAGLQKSTAKFPKLPQQIPVSQKTTVEMQDARWDRMTGISNTLQLFHISSELSIRAYSREQRKRKDRPTTKDYKSSMVREWTCPSCIGDVCSYCKKKDRVTQEGPKSAALFCSARCRFPPCAAGCGKDRPRTDDYKSSIVREWTCKECTKKSGL